MLVPGGQIHKLKSCVSISGSELGTNTREIRAKRLMNKELHEQLDKVEYVDEIYNRRCLNRFEKLANMPATESENRPPPGKSLMLGALIVVVPVVDIGKILARPTLICLIISNSMHWSQFLVAIMGN